MKQLRHALGTCLFVVALAAAARAQGGQILGVVVDEQRAPVAGAQVSVQMDARTIATTQTDEAGRFVVIITQGQAGTLAVRAPGFAPVAQRWQLNADGALQLEIKLAPAPLAETVTVTATRTETTLAETPASVVVLSRVELQTTAAATLDDALRQVVGFQLFRRAGSRTANPTTQGVSLRGVGASGASRALVLSDGIPLNDPFGGWVFWGRVPREAVARAEVLRGGASELYGSDALGGVVQLIARAPSAPTLSLELAYGNEQTPEASLFAGTTRGRWQFSLAGEEFHTDGYVLVEPSARGRIDTPAGARHATLDLMLARQLRDNVRVFVRGSVFGEARTNGTPLQTNRTHIRQLSAGGDWATNHFGAWQLRAYASTEVFDQNFSGIAADRNSETLTRVQRSPAQVFGVTAQWSRAVGTRQTFVAGFDGREVRGASNEIAYAQNRPTSFVDAGGRERTGGLYFEDIVRATTRLFVTASLRADHWRNYDATSSTRPVRAPSLASVTGFADRTETALSPQASVLYKAAAHVSLTASVYRAFRQPTLNELYRSFRVGSVVTLANADLHAEHLTGGEAGALVNLCNEHLSVRSTFFWTEITQPVANVTLSVTPALITRQRQNLGRTRTRGLELEAQAQLTRRLLLSGGYLFTDAIVASFPGNTALEGLRVPQVPRQQFTAQLSYSSPARFTFGLQARASGAQFDDDQNLLRLNPFFTLDAFAAHPIARHVSAFIAAENLFNERYDIGRTPVLTLGPPVLVRAGLRFELGAK